MRRPAEVEEDAVGLVEHGRCWAGEVTLIGTLQKFPMLPA